MILSVNNTKLNDIETLSIKCLLVILNINNIKLDTLALHVLLNINNTKFNDIQHNALNI